MDMTAVERFTSKYTVEPNTGCWLWTAHVVKGGYGRFRDGRMVLAHRWSYEHFNGPIPAGEEVDHLCRVRSCVNPQHLEAVTHVINVNRGDLPSIFQGQIWSRGTGNGQNKFTEAQILSIRDDSRPQKIIAQEYGTNQSYISRIKLRKAWGWL